MAIVTGAFVYFLLVMAAGFVLGALREFVLVPSLGRALSEPLEAPVMLAAIAASALLSRRWCGLPEGRGALMRMGLLSLALVLLAELALSPLVRGSVQAWFDSFTPLTLALSVALWIAHAAMPALVGRSGPGER